MKKNESMVFIIDRFGGEHLREALEVLGVSREDYRLVGVDGAKELFAGQPGSRLVDSKKLLAFTGALEYGRVDRAVTLAEKIKKINPTAKVVFRSTTPNEAPSSVFDERIMKGTRFYEADFIRIVQQFLGAS